MIKYILSSLLFIIITLYGCMNVSAESFNELQIDPLLISIKTIDDRRLTLQDYKGKKPVYLKFWASWCQPCREQMPHLQHIYDTHGSDLQVLAVNIGLNDDIESVKHTVKEFNITFPIVLDENSKLSQAYNLIATPYHILLNINGNIVHQGHKVTAELNNKIRLLAQHKPIAFPEIDVIDDSVLPLELSLDNTNPSILFFTSTWCDSYLKELRPNMSRNCIDAQMLVNDMVAQYSELNWQGIVTRLWTGDEDIKAYQKKYNIKHSLKIDLTNSTFLKYSIKLFPTIIAIKDNVEIFRINNFKNKSLIKEQFERLKYELLTIK